MSQESNFSLEEFIKLYSKTKDLFWMGQSDQHKIFLRSKAKKI